ncbi:protein of unknown function [Shewanella benthica]|uniref:Uncharacterized protein n=1 Tax=Shewanella benthica TaxID=43661 RepID=A0A330LXL2_9GAMM|nr:protein of unknown function [Shewanella benthica]
MHTSSTRALKLTIVRNVLSNSMVIQCSHLDNSHLDKYGEMLSLK